MQIFWSMRFCSDQPNNRPASLSALRAVLACAVLLMLLGSFGYAAEAPLPPRPASHAGWEAAAEAAGIDHSLVLLVFSAEWCGPCKLLKKETLDSKEFLEGGGALHLADVDIDA